MESELSPEKYAQELIDSHLVVCNGSLSAKIHAITDVENIIKFCYKSTGLGKYFEITPEFEFLNSVLTILREKL